MKKLLFTLTILLIATWSYTADFSPTLMTLTGEDNLQYDFDGDPLTIPLELSGTPGAIWLVINTQGQAETINAIQNGNLGWHYVNKIDTTVYVSPRYTKDIGPSNITWDGTDENGNLVVAGTYDYYFWGYDDKSPRLRAADFVTLGRMWNTDSTHLIELGEDGLPLAQPMFFGANYHYDSGNYTTVGYEAPAWAEHGIHYKWALGPDPHDIAYLQSTYCNIYLPGAQANDEDFIDMGAPALNPNDYSIFYNCTRNATAKNSTMTKWEWVSDGDAILDEDWLGWDELTWEEGGVAIGVWTMKPSCFSDRNYIYVNSIGPNQTEDEWTKLRTVSFDGEVIVDKMLHEQFRPDDNGPGSAINGSMNHVGPGSVINTMLLIQCAGCFAEMIDTTMMLEDQDVDYDDYGAWFNQNGDYFLDMNYEADSNFPWACYQDEHAYSFKRDSADVDADGFSIVGISYNGLNSISVMTQDGTGVDYMAFADDTVDDPNVESAKMGGRVCSSGSNYDGLYWASVVVAGERSLSTANFIGYDTFHGVISNEAVAVEEEAQAAFAVDQNSPNPFNPTTSISFSVPEAGHVTVDIYNVAGQKIDTLMNDFMDAGKHSVVWDALGFSNGVYFYTVKSGDFSRTMKMTLLK